MLRLIFLFFTTILLTTHSLSQKQTLPFRISPLLSHYLSASGKLKDSVNISISIKGNEHPFLKRQGLRVLTLYKPIKVLIARAAISQIANIINDEATVFVDILRTPKEEITTGTLDISLNKINYVHAKFPEVTGAGIVISIKEQQFDTSDIDYRNRYINSGVAAPSFTSHAAIMATMVAGAGNSTPLAKGAAWGSTITSSSFFSLLPDPDSVYQRFAISVQNHSYGTAIENFYGNDAAAYDASVIRKPSLLHVFSSGNVGTSTSTSGNYAGVEGFANLTGSFKMSKNSIAVGGVDSFANVAALSSKGPAYDGRVKPELVAYGEGGSSGAAALVSGTAALVQHAYKLSQSNSLPPASLTKAILINSADDIANKQVDYLSGFGNLNAYNAVKTVYDKTFFYDTISNNQNKNYPLNIPAGIQQLKITLAWTDPPAVPNAPKALVNDVDAVLQYTSTGETWLPWVLNHSPHRDSLLKHALRKKDTLNNVEQITVENLAAGTYNLQIQGNKIVSGAQPFALVYQIDTVNTFFWTYPSSTDVITAASNNVLRWQTNILGKGVIEYSTDGTLWTQITDTADLLTQYFKWSTPDTMDVALLRMRTPSQNFISDTFIISQTVDINVGFNCADSFLLTWNQLPVREYVLYYLGDKYLQSLRVTPDTFALLNKTQFPSLYYSVAPLIKGKPGLRSSTVNYTMQGVECYFRSFYLQFQNADRAEFTGIIATLFDVAEVSFQKFRNGQFITLHTVTVPATTTFLFTDSLLTQGINTYRLQVKLRNGALINTNEVTVYHFPAGAGVIIYPNPVAQGQPINIITNGITGNRIEIFNALGAFIDRIELRFTLTQVQSGRLSKGVYFIRIISDEGEIRTQKLVVY